VDSRKIVTVKIDGQKVYGRLIKNYGTWSVVQLQNYKEGFWNTDIMEVGKK
jgi:hypothetical protein